MFRELLLIATVLGCSPETPHTVEWINPSDELRPYFEQALERWERAGMTPDVIKLTNAGGAPAYLVNEPIEVNGELFDGYKFGDQYVEVIKVHRWNRYGIATTVAHEICHIFGMHSTDGICSTDLTNSFINTNSLLAACGPDSQYCNGFNPESE